MGWLRRRRSAGSAAPEPAPPVAALDSTLAVDPALGDPAAAALRAAMARGDWPAVRDFLAGVTDPDDHAYYVHLASRVPGAEGWLPGAVEAEPACALALTLAGAQAVDRAWQARGTAIARLVDDERFALFHERLKLAESHLLEAVHRDADATTAWVGLITVARGRQLGVAEAYRRFGEVTVRHPGHIRAHDQMLQQLCRKWGGSHEAMHDLDR